MRAACPRLSLYGLRGVALLAVAAPAGRAAACSGGLCAPAYLFPGSGVVPVDQLQWRYMSPRNGIQNDDGGLGHPTLYRVQGSAREVVPLRVAYSQALQAYRLEPQGEVAAGTELLLAANPPACDQDAGVEARFTVTAAATIPSTLGTLEVRPARGSIRVATWAGSCSVEVDAAYVDLKTVLSDDARALEGLIQYQLLLDGQPYTFSPSLLGGGRGDLGRGDERVFSPCAPADKTDGVAAGSHTALMRGTLPHGETFQTPEVRFELRCDQTAVPADASTPDASQTEAIPSLDGGLMDAAVRGMPSTDPASVDDDKPSIDAGTTVADRTQEETETSAIRDEAASCSTRPGSRAQASWSLYGVAALGWLLTRRRRSR